MRQCIDCAHMVDPGEFAKCHRRKPKANPRTGFAMIRWAYCDLERTRPLLLGGCGWFGWYFKPQIRDDGD